MPSLEEPLTAKVRPGAKETPPIPDDLAPFVIPAQFATIDRYLAYQREIPSVIRVADHLERSTPPGEFYLRITVAEIVTALNSKPRSVQNALGRLKELGLIGLHYAPTYHDRAWHDFFILWRLPAVADSRGASVSSQDGRRKHR